MSYSFSFNGISMTAYGLTVAGAPVPDFSQESESLLIQDRSYGFRPKKPPKHLTLEVNITATSRNLLNGYLDAIKQIIVTDEAESLELHSFPGRYWLMKLSDMNGRYRSPNYWSGSMTFVADDPTAYDKIETSSDHAIDADPKTVSEVVGGTGFVSPVYTLTAGEDLTDVTIICKNLSTDEELQWTGSLSNGEVLEIDVPSWLVNKEGAASMSTVTGQFPRLAPGLTNQIRITGFSTTGSLNITYRERYL